MWTSIRNVKFEYNVYHRCLCYFLGQRTRVYMIVLHVAGVLKKQLFLTIDL